ncbi:MAG: helix-turn-helix transcriptional regulator [Anaerolineae bacterium]|nr:helix-turn-helix transcriptional regulator [Anaerolineae bacterium]
MPRRGHGHGWQWRGYSRRAVRFLEPALLLILHHGPTHGYTMMEQLAGFGLGDNDPSALYRSLRDMEERGWLTSSWEEEQTQGPPRRVYRLTALGNEALRWWTQDVRETSQIIDHLLDSYARHMEEGEGDYH